MYTEYGLPYSSKVYTVHRINCSYFWTSLQVLKKDNWVAHKYNFIIPSFYKMYFLPSSRQPPDDLPVLLLFSSCSTLSWPVLKWIVISDLGWSWMVIDAASLGKPLHEAFMKEFLLLFSTRIAWFLTPPLLSSLLILGI